MVTLTGREVNLHEFFETACEFIIILNSLAILKGSLLANRGKLRYNNRDNNSSLYEHT
jgi:hypothetical protein